MRKDYLQVASLLQLSWWRRLLPVILPAAAPAIVAGLRISFGSALVAVVPAEMLLGELGVGYLTWIEWNNLHIAGILFAILVIGAVGVTLDPASIGLARLVTYRSRAMAFLQHRAGQQGLPPPGGDHGRTGQPESFCVFRDVDLRHR